MVAFFFIYGPTTREGRGELWSDLIYIKQGISHPVMVLGDFNEVLKPEERKGNTLISASMRDFQEWQAAVDMVELPLLSRKYTWYGNKSASRIDRVFVDIEWLEIFRDMKLWGLKRSVSDHCPLQVECEKFNWGPRPFRALDVWFTNPNFIKMVEGEWKTLANMPLHSKLKSIKDPIKKWNREVFGDIDRKVEQLEQE